MRRRQFLVGGGALVAALPRAPALASVGAAIEITMTGRPNGSKVWFDPYGVLIRPGQTVRWVNRDKANSHTATAYAAANDDHPRRIPEGAAPFDSDYLLTGESFEVTLNQPGIYDYFCIPHEMAGMVGRIYVAEPGATTIKDYPDGDLEKVVIDGFPTVADILAHGPLRHKEG